MKKFNIHDWQAKQRILKENYGKEQNIDQKRYGPEVLQAMHNLKKITDAYASYHHYQTYGFDYLALKGILDDALQNISGGGMSDEEAEERTRLGIDEGDYRQDGMGKDLSAWELLDILEKYNVGLHKDLKQYIQNATTSDHKDGDYFLFKNSYDFNMSEHHDDEDFPGKDLSAWDLLDKIKSGNTELYNKVEDFMKSMKEMNSLGSAGAGASFDAGKGAQYATPKAFGGSKNKKEVLGYKKVKDLNEQNSPKWWKKIK